RVHGVDGVPEPFYYLHGPHRARGRLCRRRHEAPRVMNRGGMMDRRQFVQTMAGAGVAIACGGVSRASAARLDKIGIQLYTVRDKMKEDVEGTLARIAEIGYKEVEF